MDKVINILFLGTFILFSTNVKGQSYENCFLADFELDTAVIPQSVDATKPVDPTTAIVRIEGDTLGKVSDYVFGNAIAAWAGAHNNIVLVDNIKMLAPTLIRFPGGSWSNGYFWNGLPSDLPDSIYDGTTYNQSTGTATKSKFWGQTGKDGWQTTTDQYYTLRQKTNVAEGLITVNYGYARYGTSPDPVAQAAHLAADWVRYDNGRTKFWEIGNENGGPWEYGWMIDTTINKDGQPQIISGELYGKHFKVFVDSMKSAARQIGATIYIGGQVVVDGPTSWNFVDRDWNKGFFQEVGDSADFYVVHNYFSSSSSAKEVLTYAVTEPQRDVNYIDNDILDKNAYLKPIALTEYNIGSGPFGKTYINGMQSVILVCEMIKNNYGLGARWLLNSGEDGMFYAGSDPNYMYHPHPDFYYLTYLQKFYGDHAISTTSSNSDIIGYASKYSSGETALIVVNKGAEERVISVGAGSVGVGQKYYIYSFTGGEDDVDSLKNVYINGVGPNLYQWGPFNQLFTIKADAYTIDGTIKFTSPAMSVQMIMIEGGTNHVTVNDSILAGLNPARASSFKLNQNYPNPVSSTTLISYQLTESAFVTLKVFDFQGKEIKTLVNEYQNEGYHSLQLNVSGIQNGICFYRIVVGKYSDTKKLVIFK